MARSFNYAILQAVPDTRRGERVNIGLVIFGPERLDVRVCETRKLSALTARSWDADIKGFGEIIGLIDDPALGADERRQRLQSVQDKLTLSANGWFEIDKPTEYETVIRELTRTLVSRPKRTRHSEGSSVVSEISAVLRRAVGAGRWCGRS